MKRFIPWWVPAILLCPSLCAAAVIQVDSPSVTWDTFVDFSGIPGSGNPGLNIDSILTLDGVSFAERFQGQTLGVAVNGVGDEQDTLSGTPASPLTLVPGAPNQNLNVFESSIVDPRLNGNGPLGFPDFSGIGEGAISLLFDHDVAEFIVDAEGFNGGVIKYQFYARNGALLDMLDLGPFGSTSGSPVNQTFAFRSTGALIAGVSVTNLDNGGVGMDNLRFQSEAVPEPSTFAMIGLFGMAAYGWRRRRKAA